MNNIINFKKPKTNRDRQIDVLKNLCEELERGPESDITSFACFVMRTVSTAPADEQAEPKTEDCDKNHDDNLTFEFIAGGAEHPAFVSFIDALAFRARLNNMENFFGVDDDYYNDSPNDNG